MDFEDSERAELIARIDAAARQVADALPFGVDLDADMGGTFALQIDLGSRTDPDDPHDVVDMDPDHEPLVWMFGTDGGERIIESPYGLDADPGDVAEWITRQAREANSAALDAPTIDKAQLQALEDDRALYAERNWNDDPELRVSPEEIEADRKYADLLERVDAAVREIADALPFAVAVETDCGGPSVLHLANVHDLTDPHDVVHMDPDREPLAWTFGTNGGTRIIESPYGLDADPADVAAWITQQAQEANSAATIHAAADQGATLAHESVSRVAVDTDAGEQLYVAATRGTRPDPIPSNETQKIDLNAAPPIPAAEDADVTARDRIAALIERAERSPAPAPTRPVPNESNYFDDVAPDAPSQVAHPRCDLR